MDPDIQEELDELEFDPYLALYSCCRLDSFVAVRRCLPRRAVQRAAGAKAGRCGKALWKSQVVTTTLVYSEQ